MSDSPLPADTWQLSAVLPIMLRCGAAAKGLAVLQEEYYSKVVGLFFNEFF